MTEVTETQRAVLSAAAQRPDLAILPLPDRLKGGAAKKVIDALIARGLVSEVPTAGREPDGFRLIASEAGLLAIGIAPPAPYQRDAQAVSAVNATSIQTLLKQRRGTKQAQLVDMLGTSRGATIEEIAEATGWQHHTVRGTIAGALKKRLGLSVTSAKEEGRGRVYRIER